jgi:hypothetical protein
MKGFGGVLVVGVAVLLSGCASVTGGGLVTSDIDPSSKPAFLAIAQEPSDIVDEIDVASRGIDPGTTRFQGEWEGHDVYLGVSGESTVNVITGVPGDEDTWGSGSSNGNVVIGYGLYEEITMQYLPHGSANPPEGWTALSDYMIVRE